MAFVRVPFQQAFFVPSIAEAVDRWVATTGAGPFFLAPHHTTDWFRYRDEDVEADVSYAFGYAGDIQIQFIEQHDDTPSLYREMYADGEGGFHHIGVLADDYDGERQRLLDQGFEIATELRADGAQAVYFDTREAIGAYTEVHSTPERIITTFGRWKAAHQEWDGFTDPLRGRLPPA
jgi:catechol 2,3-dioxygenase-like lactoylglutathione lyase family enzyme